jgi:ubiquinone/menaquinone biosynthesis C-methylase UbiE
VTDVARIATTQREWEDLAQVDPLWAILSEKDRQFGRWDQEEFFASGQREIDALMRSCGLAKGNNGRALDFGCGVGRLSAAMRLYFSEVCGVDVSENMIRLARQHSPACAFFPNQTDKLSMFQDDFFDFVYSNIVLQHQATKQVVKAYIAEFVRVVKPSGMIVFQMPYKISLRGALQPRRRLYALLKVLGFSAPFLYNRLHLNPMRTIHLPSDEVHHAVSQAGGRLVRSYPDSFNRSSMSYVVKKASAI